MAKSCSMDLITGRITGDTFVGKAAAPKIAALRIASGGLPARAALLFWPWRQRKLARRGVLRDVFRLSRSRRGRHGIGGSFRHLQMGAIPKLSVSAMGPSGLFP